MRTRVGRKSPGDLALLGEHEGWELWMRLGGGAWTALHLFSSTRRRGRVSFWLGWNSVEHRFSRTKDQGALAAHYPELVRWVQEVVERAAEEWEVEELV
jgi:hypothetical protein